MPVFPGAAKPIMDATERAYRAVDGDNNPIAGVAVCAAGGTAAAMVDVVGTLEYGVRRLTEEFTPPKK